MKQPRLSVTVLNYNYAHYLPRCLDSILAQTFRDFEVILIDDCSPESPVKVIEPYLKDERVRFVQHKLNRGFAQSLIEGTEVLSQGELRTVISADDLVLDPDAFRQQIEMFDSNVDVALCFSACSLVYEDGHRLDHHSLPQDTVLEVEDAFRHFVFDRQFWAMHSGAMFSKTAYDKAGGYRRDMTMPLDLDLWLKLCLEGKTAYCDTVLYGYGVHGGQMSVSKFKKNAQEVRQVIRDAAVAAQLRLGLDAGRIRHKGLQRQLEPLIEIEAFAGGRRAGAAALLAWLSVAPIETATSQAMLVALIKLTVGDRGFERVQSLYRRLKHK